MISCGVREILRFLVQHKLVDVIVTTAGGIEEDFIKCIAPSFIGDFNANDIEMRKNALNRIGNLIVPNDNYCKFEDWCLPLLDELLQEQKEQVREMSCCLMMLLCSWMWNTLLAMQ